MNNMKKFFNHLNGKTTTYEGGTGYKMTFKESLAEFFSLGLLNGKFYQSQEEVLEDASSTFEQALKECPEFATKAAIYGATVNSLKLVPTIWLVYLSTLEDKVLFKSAFKKIIRNLNMLHDFMEICRKAGIREGLGRGVKRAVNDRLFEFLNDYNVSRNKGTISEIIKVTRPNFKDETSQNYMKYVSNGELTFERAKILKDVLNKIENNNISDNVLNNIKKYKVQLEELKHAFKITKCKLNNDSKANAKPNPLNNETKLENLLNKMLKVNDLENLKKVQNEIVNLNSIKPLINDESAELSFENKKIIYGTLYEGLRYAALMMNLVSLERVFATKTNLVNKYSQRGNFKQEIVLETDIPAEIVKMVCSKINSIKDYRGSNILPFTLLNAEKMVVTNDFKKAIHNMLEVSSKEAFNLKKDISILVGVDTSGSMTINLSDSLSAIDVASFFGALIKCSHENSKVCAIASTCKNIKFNNKNIFDMAYEIEKTNVGAGTYFESIMDEYNEEKYIILITDSMAADNLENLWVKTKKPNGAKLIVWQLAAYKTKISTDPSVIYLAGYSDRLLSLIKSIIESEGSQIDEIEKIDIFKI